MRIHYYCGVITMSGIMDIEPMEIKPINPLGNIEKIAFIKFLGNEEFVNKLLRTKNHDDVVYECHATFAIGCYVRNPEGCLFRWLYEQTFLRNKTVSKYIPEKKFMFLHISLAEIFQFIYSVTPPQLKTSIATLNSISEIIDVLNTFLTDKESQYYQYYLNMFEHAIRFGEFETNWLYSKNSELALKLSESNDKFVKIVDSYVESPKYVRLTFALNPTAENVNRIQEFLAYAKISNAHKNDDSSIYLSIAKI